MSENRESNTGPVDGRQNDESQRLYAMLLEDTGSPEEAERLLASIQRLRRWQSPEPSPEATQKLIASLRSELPDATRSHWRRLSEWWPLLLVRSQLMVVKGEIWTATALVMLLGIVITLITDPATEHSHDLLFVLVAPIVAAIGVAFLYGTEVEQILELERSTPTTDRMLFLMRLVLVFGFNLVLGLAGSVLLALTRADISLWPLVASWLAPMAFLSTLAFLISVVFSDPLAGTMTSLALWIGHSVFWFSEVSNLDLMIRLPNMLAAETRPWLWSFALIFGLVALWLVGNTERRIGDKL